MIRVFNLFKSDTWQKRKEKKNVHRLFYQEKIVTNSISRRILQLILIINRKASGNRTTIQSVTFCKNWLEQRVNIDNFELIP